MPLDNATLLPGLSPFALLGLAPSPSPPSHLRPSHLRSPYPSPYPPPSSSLYSSLYTSSSPFPHPSPSPSAPPVSPGLVVMLTFTSMIAEFLYSLTSFGPAITFNVGWQACYLLGLSDGSLRGSTVNYTAMALMINIVQVSVCVCVCSVCVQCVCVQCVCVQCVCVQCARVCVCARVCACGHFRYPGM